MIKSEHHKIPGKYYPTFESIKESQNVCGTPTGVPSVNFSVWSLPKEKGEIYIEIGDVRLYTYSEPINSGGSRWNTITHCVSTIEDNHQKQYPTVAWKHQSQWHPIPDSHYQKYGLFSLKEKDSVLSLINNGSVVPLRDKNGNYVYRDHDNMSSIREKDLHPGKSNIPYGNDVALVKNAPENIRAMTLYLQEIDNVKYHLRYVHKHLQAKEMGIDVSEINTVKKKYGAMKRSVGRTNAIEKYYDSFRHAQEHLGDFMKKFTSDEEYTYSEVREVMDKLETAKVNLRSVTKYGKI